MADVTQPDPQATPAEPAPAVEQPAAPAADPTPVSVSDPPAPAAEAPAPSAPEAPATQPAPVAPAPAAPVRVDSTTVRSDDDALEGHFAKVVEGVHAGQIGVYAETLEHDPQTGYPSLVLLHFRDATYSHATAKVPYEQIRPVPGYQGGR